MDLNKKMDEVVVKEEDTNICPRCGNTLVLRTAKRGDNVDARNGDNTRSLHQHRP